MAWVPRGLRDLADQPVAGDDGLPDVDAVGAALVDDHRPLEVAGRPAHHPGRDPGCVLDRRQVEKLLEVADLGPDRALAQLSAAQLGDLSLELGVLVLQASVARHALGGVAHRIEPVVDDGLHGLQRLTGGAADRVDDPVARASRA